MAIYHRLREMLVAIHSNCVFLLYTFYSPQHTQRTLKVTTHLIFICRDVYLISASFLSTHAAPAVSVVWMTRYQNFTVVARYKAPDWKCSEVRFEFTFISLSFTCWMPLLDDDSNGYVSLLVAKGGEKIWDREKNESDERVRGGNSVLSCSRARNDINQVTTMLTGDMTRMFKRRCWNKTAEKTSKFWKSFNCSLGWDKLELLCTSYIFLRWMTHWNYSKRVVRKDQGINDDKAGQSRILKCSVHSLAFDSEEEHIQYISNLSPS